MFQVGDKVKLKSGGPVMTVQDIGDWSPHGPVNGVQTTWFDKDDVRHTDVFDGATLEQA